MRYRKKLHKTHVCCSGDNLHNFMGDGPMAFLNMDMGHMAKKIMGHVKHCMSNFEGWVPYNIEENENNYLITIPLPGLSKDDVKVSLISNNLNISAKKPSEEIKDKKPEDQKEDINCGGVIFKDLLNYLWNKDVNLDVPLPSDIDREKIISKMNNGLLKIKIEKLPPKNININTGDNLN